MAQVFRINSTTLTRIVSANWQDAPVNRGLDGATGRQRWVSHVWQTNVLSASEFNSLYALEGTKVSITTTDYANRNAADYITYFGVDFRRITGDHAGPIFENVVAEFLVRL